MFWEIFLDTLLPYILLPSPSFCQKKKGLFHRKFFFLSFFYKKKAMAKECKVLEGKLDSKRIYSELICGVCLDPLEAPVCHSKCKNSFCLSCITATQHKCPICQDRRDPKSFSRIEAKFVLNLLDQVRVQCTECKEEMTRAEFRVHPNRCVRCQHCPKPFPRGCEFKSCKECCLKRHARCNFHGKSSYCHQCFKSAHSDKCPLSLCEKCCSERKELGGGVICPVHRPRCSYCHRNRVSSQCEHRSCGACCLKHNARCQAHGNSPLCHKCFQSDASRNCALDYCQSCCLLSPQAKCVVHRPPCRYCSNKSATFCEHKSCSGCCLKNHKSCSLHGDSPYCHRCLRSFPTENCKNKYCKTCCVAVSTTDCPVHRPECRYCVRKAAVGCSSKACGSCCLSHSNYCPRHGKPKSCSCGNVASRGCSVDRCRRCCFDFSCPSH